MNELFASRFGRFVTLGAVCLMLASAFSVSVAAPSSARTAATIEVVFNAPEGVPALVRLVGPTKTTLKKSESGSTVSLKATVRAGRYRVVAVPVAVEGVRYVPKLSTKRLVVGSGGSKSVRLTMVKGPFLGVLTVADISAASVRLTWTLAPGASFSLRRTSGSKPAQRPKQGTLVTSSGNSASIPMSAGQTSSFALFVRLGKGRPVRAHTLRVTAPNSQDTNDEAFAYDSDALILTPQQAAAQLTSVSGETALKLPAGAPTPVLGSGVLVPISDAAPSGLLAKVSAVSADGSTAILAQGALTDVFDYLDLDVNVGGDEVVSAQGAQAITRSAATETALAASDGPTFCNAASVGIQVNNLKLGMQPSGHLRARIRSNLGVPRSVDIDFKLAPTVRITADVDVTVAARCKVAEITLAKTITTAIPLALIFKIGLEVYAEGTGSFKSVSLPVTMGVEGSASFGSMYGVHASPVFERGQVSVGSGSLDLSVGLRAFVSLTFGPGVVAEGGGQSGGGAVAGIQGSADLMNAKLMSTDVLGKSCTSVTAESKASIDLVAQIWAGPLAASAKLNLVEFGPRDWFEDPLQIPAGCLGGPTASPSPSGTPTPTPTSTPSPQALTPLFSASGLADVSVSRNGAKIAHGKQGSPGFADVLLTDAVTGATMTISPGDGPAGHPSISDDGQLVAYSGYNSHIDPTSGWGTPLARIFFTDTTTGHTQQVWREQDGGQFISPLPPVGVSGNGKFVYFATERADSDPSDVNSKVDLYQFDTVAGSSRRLTNGLGGLMPGSFPSNFYLTVSSLAANADGTQVVLGYWDPQPSGPSFSVSKFNVETGALTRMMGCQTPKELSISSSGRLVSFICDGVPYLYDSSTGITTTLQGQLSSANHLAITGDGAYLFVAPTSGGVYRYNVNTGATVFVTASAWGLWSGGTGDYVYVAADGQFSKWTSQ